MPRTSSPFYNGGLASGGMTYAVPPGRGGGGSGILNGVRDIASALLYDPERDPRAQQAGYYKAQAEQTAAETARIATKDSVIGDATRELAAGLAASPERAAEHGRAFMTKAAAYIDPDKFDEFLSTNMALGAPTSPIQEALVSTLAAAGGNAVNQSEDILVGKHDARVATGEKLDRDKAEYEHSDRVRNIDTDASVARRGQDIGSADQRRGQNLTDARTRESTMTTDRRERELATGMETTSVVQETPATEAKPEIRGWSGKVKQQAAAAAPKTTTTRTTKTPRAAPPAAKADPLGIR